MCLGSFPIEGFVARWAAGIARCNHDASLVLSWWNRGERKLTTTALRAFGNALLRPMTRLQFPLLHSPERLLDVDSFWLGPTCMSMSLTRVVGASTKNATQPYEETQADSAGGVYRLFGGGRSQRHNLSGQCEL